MTTNVERVRSYLEQVQIFYVTTVDGDQPKCRPFSFQMEYEGKIYFGVGTFKNCYRQMTQNPKVEICASNGQDFLRYYGKAVFVDYPAILQKAFAIADYLPKMYNERTGHKLGMFYLDDATAEFCSLSGVKESLKL